VKFAQAFVVVCIAFGVLAGAAAADRSDLWTGPVTGTFARTDGDLSCALIPGYNVQASVHYRGTIDMGSSTADLAVDACVTDFARGGEAFVGSFSLRGENGTLRGYAAGHEQYLAIPYFQIALGNSAHSPTRLVFQGCESGTALLGATMGPADAPTDMSCAGP
jgi:hypothetical protein